MHPDHNQHHRAEHGGAAERTLVVALGAGRVALGIGRGQGGHHGLLLGSASGSIEAPGMPEAGTLVYGVTAGTGP